MRDQRPALPDVVVQFDDIIFALQEFGGISTYWRQLGATLQTRGNIVLVRNKGRRSTRLLPVRSGAPVFHSSYFRTPLSARTRCVVTVHDLAFERGIVRSPTRAVSRRVRARAIHRADAIVCVSDSTKRELLQYYPNVETHASVRVIHHGCGWITDQARGALRTKKGQESPYALFVGGRRGYKNFGLALEAFALSSFGREASLVCSGEPWSEGERQRIRELGLATRVVIESGVSPAGLADLYRGATVLLYPSGYEGFGLPILEAMSQGCPVIALEQSVIPEIAGEAGVLLADDDPQAMADAIDMTTTSENRQRLVDLSLKNARRFSWSASAAAHEQLYRELS